MVLKVAANDRRSLGSCYYEFRRSRSETIDWLVAVETKTTYVYERGFCRFTKCSMGIHLGAQLAQETATQKFVDCSDHLAKGSALATVKSDSSIRPIEDSYEPWNEVSQQMLQYGEH
ncbi:hypothetical protein TNCV_721151 [Trichonephila clavipes]|nr:hypothetical protein TNCV_721151 [Trichonephila clavipes]